MAKRRLILPKSYKLPPPTPARKDGRPLYFVQPGDGPCVMCERMGLKITHKGTLYMNDPANSPVGDQSVYTVCRGHVPANAAIYDRWQDRCFDKNGEPLPD